VNAMGLKKGVTSRHVAMGDLKARRLSEVRSCLMRILHACHSDKKTSAPLSGQTLSSKSDPTSMGGMVQMR